MRTYPFFEAFWLYEKFQYGENFSALSSTKILSMFKDKDITDNNGIKLSEWFKQCRIGEVWQNKDYRITCDLFDKDQYAIPDGYYE